MQFDYCSYCTHHEMGLGMGHITGMGRIHYLPLLKEVIYKIIEYRIHEINCFL